MRRVWALFFVLYTISLPFQVYSQEVEPRELFSKAYTLYSQGNPAEAEPLFTQTLGRNFLLEDYSLFFLGLIQTSRSDWANGRNTFSQLKQKFPESTWASQADLQMAKISSGEKDYPRAIAELQSLKKRAIKSEIAEEASYLLAQAYEMQGDSNSAYGAYQELRQSAPLSRWAAQARQEIRKLRKQQPEQFALNTADALASEAGLLVREREYGEAEKTYRKVLELTPEGSERARFLMNLANVYLAVRKRDEANTFLAEIVARYPDDPAAPTALYRLAVAYWNQDDNLKALDYFDQLKQRYPANPFADSASFASARIYESLGRPEDALRLYREFPKRFPSSKWRAEAAWREAWIHYLRADYQQAYAVFKDLAALSGTENFGNSALYWQGRTAEKLERAEEAKQLFLRVLNSKEDTYYKAPAEKRLAALGALSETAAITTAATLPEPAPALPPDVSSHLMRAQELARISLNQLAVGELDEIRRLGRADPASSFVLVREYARNKAYGRSTAIANQIQLPYVNLERYRYPLAYWDTIQKVADERAIDPYLVLALIRQESIFDPNALSPSSAYGLMQLLPATATRAASQLGLASPQPQRLFEADLNLNLGMQHLRELLQLYSGDLVKAIAAYNAGQKAVARWERQVVTDDPEEFIERIPYGETRLYVKLVLRNHLNYRRLYGNSR